jgi:sortase A
MSDPANELPLPNEHQNPAATPQDTNAAHVIRQKVADLYTDEPAAKQEIAEIAATGTHSKHQKYMQQLLDSGKGLAEIQTAWHNYYVGLPDTEKHAVWQEFYANQSQTAHAQATKKPAAPTKQPTQHIKPKKVSGSIEQPKAAKPRNVAEVKEHLVNTVTARGKLKKSHHVQSLLFGASMGLLVVLFLMFGFFNERFIAPFVTPSKQGSSTQIIVDPTNTAAVDPEPKIVIPKINVDVPVIYPDSTDEKTIQANLENGVVHYATTPVPGQNGNVVIVGHSSNNFLNKGKYKFAFVLLNRLEVGDLFYLTYNGKRYVYKVYERKIVKPTEVAVLGDTGRPATATIITCDPPGTNTNRLVIVADQISPSISSNVAAAPTTSAEPQAAIVPGNAQSLFSRLFSWL